MQNNEKPSMLIVDEIANKAISGGNYNILLESPKYSQFPFEVLSLLYNHDNNSYQSIISHITPDQNSDYYIYNDGKTTIQRLFLPKTKYALLTGRDPSRWVSKNSFLIDNKQQYISTQWVGHKTEEKKNLRINDFALAIHRSTQGKYIVNFKKTLNKYSCQLIEITNNQSSLTNNISSFNTGTIKTDTFSIREIIKLIKETGLIYNDEVVKRFCFSLLSKRFLILSGLAGSGKTQLALAFASALVENKEQQMCVVSVGADWTNREPLLGFPNALQPGKYVKPESGVLDLLIEANKEENANKPFFLILDEMNMSYVERYFADFLSAMESKEKISLWNPKETTGNEGIIDGVPTKVALPNNLFIIGTINVDETTYMFSPKVLDRANVIEFKISTIEMKEFLNELKETNREGIIGKAADMGASFVEIASKKDLSKDDEAINTLQSFFDELKGVNAEFGYRSATEIFRFICQAKANDDTDNKMTMNDILDASIVQKLLPKLHGSRKKLEPVLQKLWKLCFEGTNKDLNISSENLTKAIYPESADKIRRMYESATANGFTSFAEA